MSNEKNVEIFKKALMVGEKCFPPLDRSILYEEKDMKVIFSEDSVESVFNAREGIRIGVLNFADGYTPGGLVWQGACTQEEALCRASNLYLYLDEDKYPIDGKLLYSRDVVFYMGADGKLRSPRKADVITCPAPICTSVDAERRMRMIVDAARLNGVELLILGKWGCGAFGNDWGVYKELWGKVLGSETL